MVKYFTFLIVINLFSTFTLFAKTIEYSNCIWGRIMFPKNIERTDNANDYQFFFPGEYKVTQKLYNEWNKVYYGPDSNEVDKDYRGRWYYKNESYYGSETLEWSKSDYEKFITDKKLKFFKRNIRDIYSINVDYGIVTHTEEMSYDFYNWMNMQESRREELNVSKGLKKERRVYGRDGILKRLKIKRYKIENYGGGLILATDIEDQEYVLDDRQAIRIDLKKHTITKDWYRQLKDGSEMRTSIDTCMPSTFVNTENIKDLKTSGSAFFINNTGNLVTNHHVIESCKELSISYFDKEYETKVLHSDKNLDLAVLKADVRPKNYISVSKNPPKKLQNIFAAGYPLGKGLSDDLKITSGIISSIKGFKDNVNEIQIDAAINKGNSGGPIVSEDGYLVGISVSGLDKSKTESVNFGIKASSLEQFLNVNEIKYSKPFYEFSSSKDSLRKLLENSTVYISCKS